MSRFGFRKHGRSGQSWAQTLVCKLCWMFTVDSFSKWDTDDKVLTLYLINTYLRLAVWLWNKLEQAGHKLSLMSQNLLAEPEIHNPEWTFNTFKKRFKIVCIHVGTVQWCSFLAGYCTAVTLKNWAQQNQTDTNRTKKTAEVKNILTGLGRGHACLSAFSLLRTWRPSVWEMWLQMRVWVRERSATAGMASGLAYRCPASPAACAL